jgi:hypothetical protein
MERAKYKKASICFDNRKFTPRDLQLLIISSRLPSPNTLENSISSPQRGKSGKIQTQQTYLLLGTRPSKNAVLPHRNRYAFFIFRNESISPDSCPTEIRYIVVEFLWFIRVTQLR